MITQSASLSSSYFFCLLSLFFSVSYVANGNPKICHVPIEFIFISPYTPKQKAGIRGRNARFSARQEIRIARKIIIFLYHNLMFHPRFPPRFESSSNVHPRFFYTPLIFIFLAQFSVRDFISLGTEVAVIVVLY